MPAHRAAARNPRWHHVQANHLERRASPRHVVLAGHQQDALDAVLAGEFGGIEGVFASRAAAAFHQDGFAWDAECQQHVAHSRGHGTVAGMGPADAAGHHDHRRQARLHQSRAMPEPVAGAADERIRPFLVGRVDIAGEDDDGVRVWQVFDGPSRMTFHQQRNYKLGNGRRGPEPQPSECRHHQHQRGATPTSPQRDARRQRAEQRRGERHG